MAYYDLALLTQDQDFRMRCVACATLEQVYQPEQWVWDNIWRLAAAPGFADAYASAIVGAVENPGRDQAVITDPQILAQIQAVLGEAAKATGKP